MARTSKKQVREILETAHGVVLYPPTDVNPYYRIVYRDSNGKRIPRSAGRDGDAAWAHAPSTRNSPLRSPRPGTRRSRTCATHS